MNIIFRMDSGYFSEEIAEVIKNAGYQYVIKAKHYPNMVGNAHKRPIKIWEAYGDEKQAMFCCRKPDKWNKAIIICGYQRVEVLREKKTTEPV